MVFFKTCRAYRSFFQGDRIRRVLRVPENPRHRQVASRLGDFTIDDLRVREARLLVL